jgi:uncharacterized protein (TIGR02453 family)
VRAIFSSASLAFLRGLKRHNNKPWFEAHRDDYESQVRGPMRALIEEMDVRLARFAAEIMADPKRSMFRIHRDIRFSHDKSPYKTNAGCWFYHRDGSSSVGQEAEPSPRTPRRSRRRPRRRRFRGGSAGSRPTPC